MSLLDNLAAMPAVLFDFDTSEVQPSGIKTGGNTSGLVSFRHVGGYALRDTARRQCQRSCSLSFVGGFDLWDTAWRQCRRSCAPSPSTRHVLSGHRLAAMPAALYFLYSIRRRFCPPRHSPATLPAALHADHPYQAFDARSQLGGNANSLVFYIKNIRRRF